MQRRLVQRERVAAGNGRVAVGKVARHRGQPRRRAIEVFLAVRAADGQLELVKFLRDRQPGDIRGWLLTPSRWQRAQESEAAEIASTPEFSRRLVRSVKSFERSAAGLSTVTPRVSWNPWNWTFISLFCAQLRPAISDDRLRRPARRVPSVVARFIDASSAAAGGVVDDHPTKDLGRLGHAIAES